MVKLRHREREALAKEFLVCEGQEARPSRLFHKATPFLSVTPKCVPTMKLRPVLRRRNPPGPRASSSA